MRSDIQMRDPKTEYSFWTGEILRFVNDGTILFFLDTRSLNGVEYTHEWNSVPTVRFTLGTLRNLSWH